MPSVYEAELPFLVTCGGESVVQGAVKVADIGEKNVLQEKPMSKLLEELKIKIVQSSS